MTIGSGMNRDEDPAEGALHIDTDSVDGSQAARHPP